MLCENKDSTRTSWNIKALKGKTIKKSIVISPSESEQALKREYWRKLNTNLRKLKAILYVMEWIYNFGLFFLLKENNICK